MIKATVNLQDLRRKISIKAKADKTWRFWGIYVHICKMETLRASYKLAKRNQGAPGIDGVTFEKVESEGVDKFLQSIQAELSSKTYYPMRNRKQAIPKTGGRTRILSIPTVTS